MHTSADYELIILEKGMDKGSGMPYRDYDHDSLCADILKFTTVIHNQKFLKIRIKLDLRLPDKMFNSLKVILFYTYFHTNKYEK